MFGFKEIGQFANIMKQLPKIKEEMDKFQAQLAQITAEGNAGAGMVVAKVNGKNEVLSCKISDEAMKDREMLEDLIVSAINQAIAKVREQTAAEACKMGNALGLPPGMGLPGLE